MLFHFPLVRFVIEVYLVLFVCVFIHYYYLFIIKNKENETKQKTEFLNLDRIMAQQVIFKKLSVIFAYCGHHTTELSSRMLKN